MGTKGGSLKLYTCSNFPLEIIFDAESTGYVHTTFCRLSRLKKTKAALKNNGLNFFFFFHIYTSETYIFYRDHCTKKSQMESFKSVGRVRLQLSEKGSYVMTRRAGLLCNSCCVHVRVCAYVCVRMYVCMCCLQMCIFLKTSLFANVASVWSHPLPLSDHGSYHQSPFDLVEIGALLWL